MDLFGEEPAAEPEEGYDPDEGFVEPEPQEGLLSPRLSDFCLGHETLEQDILSQITQERLPHAMIFSGQRGIGKATFAYRLLKYLLHTGKTDPNQGGMFDDAPAAAPESFYVPGDSTVLSRIASGGHPDLMTVERAMDEAKGRQKDSIDIAQIRKITPFMRMTASEGGWRIVLIDDADTMNRNAQNALLKILEEPPENSLIILVAHRAGELIPTIRSRARLVRFQPLNESNMQSLLSKQGHMLSHDEMLNLVHMSGGSMNKALELIEENGLETLGKIFTVFDDYPALNWANIHVLADELGRAGKDNAYNNFTQMLLWTTRQLAIHKARGGGADLSGPLAHEALQTLVRQSSLESLSEICENLDGLFSKVSRANLDKRQSVLEAFDMLKAA